MGALGQLRSHCGFRSLQPLYGARPLQASCNAADKQVTLVSQTCINQSLTALAALVKYLDACKLLPLQRETHPAYP